ncbi:exodeoxyribonuclease III [uncultured Propionibacterium sp.]|uniref:exodeoxyribonuclease III n=1 Tax=uncultured Propionibacterium sp. TaxID=218066 RepID=UPI00292E12FA|nr:exodeoxyribonuclease III [uncultured Propionibacterium sp.]
MTLATYNVNGIRAARRRGLSAWIRRRSPDVICLQETRCPADRLPSGIFEGYRGAYCPGVLAGRNGVAVLTRAPATAVRTWGGEVFSVGDERTTPIDPGRVGLAGGALARALGEFVDEGRYLEVDLADEPVTVACLYLPKGDSLLAPSVRTRAPTPEQLEGVRHRYERKMRFLEGFRPQLARSRRAAARAGRQFVVVGDFNIARDRADVKNWRPAQKASGFLPEERAWLAEQLGPRTLVDVVRSLHPDESGPYSWWSWMGRAFARDTGWRIDYHLAAPGLARTAVSGTTERDPDGSARVSDHCPVVVTYDTARL